MDFTAKVTAKGQVTIPEEVRAALGIEDGDHVMFRVEARRAVITRTLRLVELGGSVKVPASKRGATWSEVVAATRRSRHGR